MTTPHDTPAPLSPEEVRAARERAERATKGPWRALVDYDYSDHTIPERYEFATGVRSPDALVFSIQEGSVPDAEFCAAARSDVPRLADALERAWRERDEARKELAREERAAEQLIRERDRYEEAIQDACAALGCDADASNRHDKVECLHDVAAFVLARVAKAEAERDKARGEVERLRAALESYGQHASICLSRIHRDGAKACDCGWTATWRKLLPSPPALADGAPRGETTRG